MAASTIAVLANEDNGKQESEAAAWSDAWKNSYLRQLAEHRP